MLYASPSATQVAVICGLGSGGIGDACARLWSSKGYTCALLARTESRLTTLAQSIPNSRPYVCDVCDAAQIHSTVAKIEADLGPIDHLIFNAGAGAFKSFESTTAEDFQQCFQTGPAGLFNFAKAVILLGPKMILTFISNRSMPYSAA